MAIVSTIAQTVGVPENLLSHAIVVLITLSISSTFLLWSQFEKEVSDASKPLTASEPPVASASIPIIGHMIGLRKHQIKYLEILR